MKEYTDQELRKLIIERYTNPHHFGLTKNPDLQLLTLDSPNCADRLSLELAIVNDHVCDLKFGGSGCAIAIAAADLLIDQLSNQKLDVVHAKLVNYKLLIDNDPAVNWEALGELIAFKNIHRQKGRIKCATLVSEAIENILKEAI